jgi:hypothetical protein
MLRDILRTCRELLMRGWRFTVAAPEELCHSMVVYQQGVYCNSLLW